jgi:iron complex transport system substrate-binding protein
MPFRSPAALLAALLLLASATLFAAMGPARAAEFTDAAGRRVVLPDQIRRIMPAERNAEVLVFVLAPDKLVGLGRASGLARAARLPVLGWRPRSTPASMAQTARQLRPDLIIDAGTVTAERAAFADQVSRLTGIPYILVDDSFARMPRVLRSLGVTLGVDDRRGHDLFIFAEQAIAALRGRLLIRPADARPHIYYALGADGLTTALPGSPAGEAIDEAGAINVATPLGRGTEVAVRREQLLAWDPQIIIAAEPSAYRAFERNSAWRRLSAVRNKRVYLEPSHPFGWIEDPPGVNRLIGLYWLSSLFYPDSTQEDLRTRACEFYAKFYRIKLTNARLEAMVRPAGAPPLAVPTAVGEPLVGLGAAPPSSLAPGMPGAAGALGEMSATAPTATCSPPTGLSPLPLSEAAPSPAARPGVPPPGRRGRPAAELGEPGAPPH